MHGCKTNSSESSGKWAPHSFLQLSSTKLGSTFESTAELNYLGRPKLVLGSAHVKFDVWAGPNASHLLWRKLEHFWNDFQVMFWWHCSRQHLLEKKNRFSINNIFKTPHLLQNYHYRLDFLGKYWKKQQRKTEKLKKFSNGSAQTLAWRFFSLETFEEIMY